MILSKIFCIIAGLICFLSLTACKLQPMTSVTGDKAYVSAPPGSSSNFLAVRTIIRNNCISCHANYPTYSESDWLTANLVIAGDASDSVMFQHLKGSNVGGPQDMPQGGQLSSGDISTIQTWIMNISTTAPPVVAGPPSAVQRTANVIQIIQTSCISCHGSTAGLTATSTAFSRAPVPQFATFTTDNDFVSQGMVIPGDSAQSWLYLAISNGGLSGSTLMPETGTLSSTQIATIKDWIDNIGNP